MTRVALALPTDGVTPSLKAPRLVRQDLPWQSHAGYLKLPPCPPCALAHLPGGSVPWSSQAQAGNSQSPSSYPFLRWVQRFPFSSHLRLHLTAMTFQISQSGLETTPPKTLRILGHIRFHRFLYIQVPQKVTNLISWYSEREFAPPVLVLWSIWDLGREVASEDWGKKKKMFLYAVGCPHRAGPEPL